jgi:hypothetical protein
MAQQQSQSQSSRGSSQSQGRSQGQSQGQGLIRDPSIDPSLSEPASPDATSPYEGPADQDKPHKTPDRVADKDGPAQMEQPYFSEAQSTFGAFEPVERPGDRFAQPEDQVAAELARKPREQADSAPGTAHGAEFATASGTVRTGMTVVDSYGHAIGVIAGVEGDRLRLASTDPHDDGVAFLPTSLIDGVDGERVLLVGRGDASFGMPSD